MFDDERDFWADEPTRSLPLIGARDKRPPVARERRHAVESATPPRWRSAASDPFLRRLGVMVTAVLVAIPVAATMRDDGAEGVIRSSVGAEAALVPAAGAPSSSDLAASVAAAESSIDLVPSTPASTAAAETIAPETLASTVAPTAPPATVPPSVAATAAATAAPATTSAPATTAAARVERVVAAAPTCTTGYDVVAGDYWILIADKIDVSTAELFAANGAGPDTPLYPGRTICVPAGASATTTTDAPATTQAPATTAAPKPTTTTAPKPTATTAPKATTTTEAPAPTVPQRSYTAAEVEQIIREVWPDDLEEEALRIARRESNLQPTAKNYCCYGLFQLYYSVHKGWLGQIGVTSSSHLFDPRINANAALALYYRSGGFGPWT